MKKEKTGGGEGPGKAVNEERTAEKAKAGKTGKAGGRGREALLHASLSALFAALIAVGAMLSLPAGDVKFTFQLLAVLLAAGLLPVYDCAAAVFVYILLGAFGLPVFAGFTGGVGVLTGPTGGFVLGFLPAVLAVRLLLALLGKTRIPRFPKLCAAFVSGVLVCYLCGLAVMCAYYPEKGLLFALQAAILPYLPFDALKVLCAALIVDRVGPHLDKLLGKKR